MSNFIKFLNEFNKTTIKIDNTEYTLVRTHHIKQGRGKSNIPRDGNTSASKYEKMLNLGWKHIDKSSAFTLTFTYNNLNYAYSFELNNTTINAFSAIVKEKQAPEKLFGNVQNRYHLGNINFN